ncbi:MAG: hypothetical protein Kow00102_18090 [Spirochaetota bacterium]
MRTIVLYIVIIFVVKSVFSQEWIPPGGDTLWISPVGTPIVRGFYSTETALYMGGGFTNCGSTTLMRVGKWDTKQ